MKKILKISLYSLLIFVFLVLAIVHILYSSFSPGDKGVPVTQSNLVYFQESYDECRQSFLSLARKVSGEYDQAELFSIKVPSHSDTGLYIDLLYLPPFQNTEKLLVLSSGVHGVEGFTGGAVQQMFLKEQLTSDVLMEMGILLIYGVNPYGLKYGRRVSENNVDLNRGSEVDSKIFESKNPGYGALYDMLNPQGKVSTGSLRNQFFYLITISKMMKESMSALRQAIVQGQYEYPEGIFFGGNDFEPQIDSLRRILPDYFKPYETIMAIDLHTGYGSRGVLHLFPNPVDDPEIKQKTESVFEGHHIDWGNSDDFYTITGGFVTDFMSKINPEAIYLYMVFEWGTFDSQKTFGSIKSLQKIINENQGFHYGYKNQKHEQKIMKNNLELYFPDSEAWRSEVLGSGREMLSLVLKTYPAVD
ncbi:MAG: DUF2817 domain-containing protein [Bacteroidales bacterium]|nr:DUF2817 domain-containing protein [Bacteroidales bacterium]